MSTATRGAARGLWAALPPPQALPDDPPPLARVGPVVVRVYLRDGERLVDLSDLPCPRLAREIGTALIEQTGETGGRRSGSSLKNTVNAVRRFVGFLATLRPADIAALDLAALQPEDFDRYEQALIGRYGPTSARPHSLIEPLVGLLRIAAGQAACSAQLRSRLLLTTRVAPGRKRTPLDAYPLAVFEAVKTAALADVRAARERIQHGEALTQQGADPQVAGWDRVENLLWHIIRHGPLPARHSNGHPNRIITAAGGARYLHGLLYPTAEDVLAFVVALVCLTGLEPECARHLDADCLSDPARGFVSLHYVKRRVGPAAAKSMRIPDGGAVHHPGGLIRLAQRLTQLARQHLGSNALWVARGRMGHGLFDAFAAGAEAVNAYTPQWLTRHGLDQLADNDGTPLRRLDLRRLRKSVKSQQYLRAAGVLADFTHGHSRQVAASHYADIAAHRDIHEQAVEDGLVQALQVALPPVVLDDDGSRLDNGTIALPPVEVATALSGASDVFLASCRDFHNTPHAPPGKACPVPMWGCLECPNAVFTTRHLPQHLTFLDFMQRQRDELPTAEWTLRYGTAVERIMHGVRDRFSADQLATARAIAEGTGGPLLLPVTFWDGLT